MSESLQLPIAGIDTLCGAWSKRWYALVSASSASVSPAVAARLATLTRTLLTTDSHTDPLAVTQLVETSLDSAQTGLPVDVAQRLGIRALTEVLCENMELSDLFAQLQTAALPWLQHPYFPLASLQQLAAASDLSSIIDALVAELRSSPYADGICVWRFVHDDSPLIEIAGPTSGRYVTLTDRPDLAQALASGSPLSQQELVIIPLRLGEQPFALVEISVPPAALAEVTLQVLTLVRLAEQSLKHISRKEQQTTLAIWQRVLNHLAQVLTVTHSADDILAAMADQVRQALPCERIAFWEYQPEPGAFRLRSLSARLTGHYAPAGSVCPAEDTPLQVAWYSGQPLLLGPDWMQRFPNYPSANETIKALAVIPIVFEFHSLGILTIERLEPRLFTRQESEWLMLIGGMVGAALHNIEVHQTLKATQERMMEDAKMRALGEMAAGIAHDFNNILMGILCNVELLKFASDVKQVQERLPRLERAIMDARAIVQRVSTFGRKDQHTDFVPVHLAGILADTVELLHPQLVTKGIIVQAHYDQHVWVMGHAAELREVVTNLITNAIHSMPHGGTLTLRCAVEDHIARAAIQDTGVGMSPAVLSRAFDPFFSTKGGMGTGLGLSVSYRIIHQHNGTMRLESTEGVGTTVLIEIPACPPQPAEMPDTSRPGRALRILLVEDNEEISETLSALLGHLGHRPSCAHNARDGIALFGTSEFDLIITDLAMCGETGDSVAHAVRNTHSNIPIILLSGSLDLEEGSGHLYDSILQKPITLDSVQEAITQVTAQS